VAPGEHHAVNARFDLANLQTGDLLEADFFPAVQIGGNPTANPKIPIRVD
jgi:hypothetical protein